MGRAPLGQEAGYGRGLHAAHGFKLAGLLAIKQSAFFAEHGECRHALAEGDAVPFGDVQVLIHVADVDVDQHKIGIENGQILRVVEVDIQHLTVSTPVASEIEQNPLVGLGRGPERGGDVGLGLRGIGIDFAAGGVSRAGHKRQSGGEGEELDHFHEIRILQMQSVFFSLPQGGRKIPLFHLPVRAPRHVLLKSNERSAEWYS